MTVVCVCLKCLSNQHARAGMSRWLCSGYSLDALQCCRQQLVAQLGQVEDAALSDLLQQARTLAAHQQQRRPTPPGSSVSGGSQSTSAGAAAKTSVPLRQEFGADLEFHQPRLYPSADEAVLAMCGAGFGSAKPGQPRWVT